LTFENQAARDRAIAQLKRLAHEHEEQMKLLGPEHRGGLEAFGESMTILDRESERVIVAGANWLARVYADLVEKVIAILGGEQVH
jgi:hypothetical protein